MTQHKVQLADCPPQAWRNGGGQTQALLTWPATASGYDDWWVRVSVARISADGPFSAFPGVQRWFAVVQGAGVALEFADEEVTLTKSSPPLSFDGARAPGCKLLGGPTQDLNFMVRSEAGPGRMSAAHPGSALSGPHPWRGLYVAQAALVDLGQGAETLPAGTLLWSDARTPAPWQVLKAPQAWWLNLEAR